MFSLFKKTESYLGVDLGSGGMKIAEIRKVKGRPQLWTYGILDQPLDVHIENSLPNSESKIETSSKDVRGYGAEEKKKNIQAKQELADPRVESYSKLLRYLAERAHVTAKSVTASLPVSLVFHAILTLPSVPEKEIEFHIRAKVAKMLPRPIDEMQVVHQIISKGKANDIKALVTAAPKSLIKFYTDIFQKAGLTLEELETEAFAIARSLVGRDIATVMVVDIGAERTNFFIIDNGYPVTHRSIQIGGNGIDRLLGNRLGIPEESVRQMKFDLSRSGSSAVDADIFAAVTEPIIKEIQYGFDLFLSQSGNENKRPEKIILTGGASLFPPFVSSMQKAFDIKVFVGDPWARVVYQQKLKPTLDAIGPRMGVAIGLSLRKIFPRV